MWSSQRFDNKKYVMSYFDSHSRFFVQYCSQYWAYQIKRTYDKPVYHKLVLVPQHLLFAQALSLVSWVIDTQRKLSSESRNQIVGLPLSLLKMCYWKWKANNYNTISFFCSPSSYARLRALSLLELTFSSPLCKQLMFFITCCNSALSRLTLALRPIWSLFIFSMSSNRI